MNDLSWESSNNTSSPRKKNIRRRGMFTISNFVSNVLRTDEGLTACKLVTEDCVQKAIFNQLPNPRLYTDDVMHDGKTEVINEIRMNTDISKEIDCCDDIGNDIFGEKILLEETLDDSFEEGGPYILVTPETNSETGVEGPFIGSSMQKHTVYTISASMFATFCKFYNENLMDERQGGRNNHTFGNYTSTFKKTCDQYTQTLDDGHNEMNSNRKCDRPSTSKSYSKKHSSQTFFKDASTSTIHQDIESDVKVFEYSSSETRNQKVKTIVKSQMPNINVADLVDEINDLNQDGMINGIPVKCGANEAVLTYDDSKTVKRKRRKPVKNSCLCGDDQYLLKSRLQQTSKKVEKNKQNITKIDSHEYINNESYGHVFKNQSKESRTCADNVKDAWFEILTDGNKIDSLSDQVLLKIIRSYSSSWKDIP